MNTHEALKEVRAKSAEEYFYIHPGITQDQVRQLIAITEAEKDPISLDGDEQRFTSLELYKAWKQKNRSIYALTDSLNNEGDLYGIFWAGKKTLPDRTDYLESLDPNFYQHTYAFRLYGAARGKGLSHPVLSFCMGNYIGNQTLPIGAWLEVSGLNQAALRMDQRMGYRVVSGVNEEGRLIMAREYR